MDNHSCPNIERCPMFPYLRTCAREVYMDVFCEGNYKICKRYQLRQRGETVPPNMLPHGGLMHSFSAAADSAPAPVKPSPEAEPNSSSGGLPSA